MDAFLSNLLTILRSKPDGASISEIKALMPNALSERTLLRRLQELKEAGEIQSYGQKRGTRYFIRTATTALTLSTEGLNLKTIVNHPIQKREPVGYQTDFLYHYQPNKSFYLTENERKHLFQQGQQFNHDLEPGTYVKRILHRLLIDLSWNSSRLEGNTYSLVETERLIEFGAEAEGKNATEAQMIMNHKDAVTFMVENTKELRFSKYMVLNIHALLSNNLLADPKARGRLRQIPVGIGRSVYNPPEIPQMITECFEYILKVAEQIEDPFEQAFFAMVQLPYLQPFEDVNKRVSRLCANIPLIRHNLSPLSFIDVPKDDYISGLLAIYELNKIELMRDVFIWAYERSAKQYKLVRDTLGEPDLFHIKYKTQLKTVIKLIINTNSQGKEIFSRLESWAQENIASLDKEHFVRVAEKEIASLHLGNIAIYQINPKDFVKWQKSRK